MALNNGCVLCKLTDISVLLAHMSHEGTVTRTYCIAVPPVCIFPETSSGRRSSYCFTLAPEVSITNKISLSKAAVWLAFPLLSLSGLQNPGCYPAELFVLGCASETHVKCVWAMVNLSEKLAVELYSGKRFFFLAVKPEKNITPVTLPGCFKACP